MGTEMEEKISSLKCLNPDNIELATNKHKDGTEETKMDLDSRNLPEANGNKVNMGAKEGKASVKVEDVFKSLGGYSKYQIFATITIVFVEIPSAMISLSPILTGTEQVSFYCHSNNDNSTMPIVPKDELCKFGGGNGSCLIDTISGGEGRLRSDEPHISIVQDWNLICDRGWITETLTSVQMVGGMLGPIVTAHIADWYGRKLAFYIICALMGISGILSANSTTLFTYGASRFLAGFAAGGGLVAHMNYLMEYLTPSWRVICGSVSLWPLGEILLGLSGYFVPSWRTLTWMTGAPAFLLFVTIPFLHESPRWLLCQNKTEEAISVFNSIAWWNGKPKPSAETIHSLQSTVTAEEQQKNGHEGSTIDGKDKKLSKLGAFKDKLLLKQILILSLTWFANALTYFGISFNMKNVTWGNMYFNVALLGVFDFPAELSGIYFSNRFGRKITFISTLAMSLVFLATLAILQLTVEDVDARYGVIILSLCLLGRFCNEASWAVMACLTGEVFPTVVRSLSFSICSMFGAVGGIIAPQMAFLGKVWTPGPYIIFCSLSLISCIASLKLTEMRGKPLQDKKARQMDSCKNDEISALK